MRMQLDRESKRSTEIDWIPALKVMTTGVIQKTYPCERFAGETDDEVINPQPEATKPLGHAGVPRKTI